MASTPHLSAQVAAASESPLFKKLAPSFDKLNIEWSNQTIATSVLAVIVTLLIAEQTLWRYRKSTLPGHSWQIVSQPSSVPSLARRLHPSPRLARPRSTRQPAHMALSCRRVARHWTIRRVAQPDHGSLQAL